MCGRAAVRFANHQRQANMCSTRRHGRLEVRCPAYAGRAMLTRLGDAYLQRRWSAAADGRRGDAGRTAGSAGGGALAAGRLLGDGLCARPRPRGPPPRQPARAAAAGSQAGCARLKLSLGVTVPSVGTAQPDCAEHRRSHCLRGDGPLPAVSSAHDPAPRAFTTSVALFAGPA